MTPELLGMWAPSFWELIIIMAIALLLFGKRLPEVARSLGKGVVEFKKGLKGIEDEPDRPDYQPPKKQPYIEEKASTEASTDVKPPTGN